MEHQILINLTPVTCEKLEKVLDVTGAHNMKVLPHILDVVMKLEEHDMLDMFDRLNVYAEDIKYYERTAKGLHYRYCYINDEIYVYYREKYNNQNLVTNFMRYLSLIVEYMLHNQLDNILDYNLVCD